MPLQENRFVFVPSEKALISRVNQRIKESTETIEIVTTCKRLQYACYCFSESLNEAWNRKIKCQIEIEKPSFKQKKIFRKCYPESLADIRFLQTIPSPVIVLFDNQEVFISTNPKAALQDSPAILSNNQSIVSLAQQFFETKWKEALPLEDKTMVALAK